MTELDAYLARIGYVGGRDATLDTLMAIFRAHVAAIPFENLDVQFGRPVGLDLPAIHAKLVGAGRGGWCYEQNGLLGWALDVLGFSVRRISGGVLRNINGDAALGNHLALIVMLDRRWLVDAGFGGSLAEPIPLVEGAHDHAPFRLTLARIEDSFWRFEEERDGNPFSFDFREDAADENLFARQCQWLQSASQSPFVANLVVQRRVGNTHRTLRGRVYSTGDANGTVRTVLDNAAELVATLKEKFGLNLPEVASLWPTICARHDVVTRS